MKQAKCMFFLIGSLFCVFISAVDVPAPTVPPVQIAWISAQAAKKIADVKQKAQQAVQKAQEAQQDVAQKAQQAEQAIAQAKERAAQVQKAAPAKVVQTVVPKKAPSVAVRGGVNKGAKEVVIVPAQEEGEVICANTSGTECKNAISEWFEKVWKEAKSFWQVFVNRLYQRWVGYDEFAFGRIKEALMTSLQTLKTSFNISASEENNFNEQMGNFAKIRTDDYLVNWSENRETFDMKVLETDVQNWKIDDLAQKTADIWNGYFSSQTLTGQNIQNGLSGSFRIQEQKNPFKYTPADIEYEYYVQTSLLNTANQWLKNGLGPAVKIFERGDIDAYLDANARIKTELQTNAFGLGVDETWGAIQFTAFKNIEGGRNFTFDDLIKLFQKDSIYQFSYKYLQARCIGCPNLREGFPWKNVFSGFQKEIGLATEFEKTAIKNAATKGKLSYLERFKYNTPADAINDYFVQQLQAGEVPTGEQALDAIGKKGFALNEEKIGEELLQQYVQNMASKLSEVVVKAAEAVDITREALLQDLVERKPALGDFVLQLYQGDVEQLSEKLLADIINSLSPEMAIRTVLLEEEFKTGIPSSKAVADRLSTVGYTQVVTYQDYMKALKKTGRWNTAQWPAAENGFLQATVNPVLGQAGKQFTAEEIDQAFQQLAIGKGKKWAYYNDGLSTSAWQEAAANQLLGKSIGGGISGVTGDQLAGEVMQKLQSDEFGFGQVSGVVNIRLQRRAALATRQADLSDILNRIIKVGSPKTLGELESLVKAQSSSLYDSVGEPFFDELQSVWIKTPNMASVEVGRLAEVKTSVDSAFARTAAILERDVLEEIVLADAAAEFASSAALRGVLGLLEL